MKTPKLITSLLFGSVALLFATNNITLTPNIAALREMYQKDSLYWERANVDEGVEYREIGALPIEIPYPESNPYSKEKVALGKKLFNDPNLSLSRQIACASCHEKDLGFADGRQVSFGHNRQKGRRNAPSIAMAAFGKEKFWDGRADSLESQIFMPITDPLEMAHTLEGALQNIQENKEYLPLFDDAFGDSNITLDRISQAIATYERSLMPKNSRFDRFMRGNAKALSDEEVWGLHLFRTKARCMNCHNGVEFSDNSYHNLGLTFYRSPKLRDLGRYEITNNPSDSGKFKTPSLRQVGKTAPYIHNGLFINLSGVLRAYNVGMVNEVSKAESKNDPIFPKKDVLLKKLDLTKEELNALEAFLKTL